MTATYDLIASNVLTSNTASVTLSSIPATYRDLVLVFDHTLTGGDGELFLRFNGDTGSNYNYVRMFGTASGTISGGASNQTQIETGSSSTTRALCTISVLDYKETDKHKSCLIRHNRADVTVGAFAARWASTSAITSITLTTEFRSFASGSTFYLYGIVS